MKKILITGASGFVGKNVYEYLKEIKGFSIYAPSSKDLDCTNEEKVYQYLTKEKFDIILHFAVYGDGIDKSKDAAKICQYNMRIFWNFAKNYHLYGKMYYTGSGAEYDKRFPIIDAKESEVGKTVPIDDYGLMKYTIGHLIEQSVNIYNLRLFGIFGKYEYWPTKFISNVCCKTIKNIPMSIRQNVYFDYLWIEDFCKIIERFIDSVPKYKTYNVVSGKKMDLLSIAKEVNQISGKNLPIFVCNEGLAKEYTANNNRLLEELEGFEFTSISKSIQKLYNWYEEHETEIDIQSLLYQ